MPIDPPGGAPDTTSASAWTVLAVITAAAGVSQAFGRFTFSLLFTEVRDSLAVTNTVAGALGSANLAAYLAGTVLVARTVGRLGLAPTLRTGVAGVTAGLLLLAWSPSLPVVLGGLLVTGLSGAAVWVTAPGLAATLVATERRGAAIGIVGAGIGAGIVVSSLLDTALGPEAWRSVYRVETAIGAVVTAACWYRLREERGWAGRRRPLPAAGPDAVPVT